jgi:hypothetical protein
MLDHEGYPTDDTLKQIKEWKIKTYKDTLELFEFIKQNWWMPDWGFHHTQKDVEIIYGNAKGNRRHEFQLSTGGWSGNEDVIRAMRENYVFWGTTWCVHRRGGHYEFEVEELEFTKS